MGKDYYKILGVDKNAAAEEIKQAFRKLAHQYHPDKAGGNEAKFKEINEAYQVLGNEKKRQQYDQFGATFDQQGGFGAGMNWDDFMKYARSGTGQDFGGFNFNFNGLDLGDIFGDIFGFGAGASRQKIRRGRDIQIDLTTSFKESVFGVKKIVELYKSAVCGNCHGKLAEPGSKMTTCYACAGQGQVRQTQRTFFGTFATTAVCPECQGAGQKPEKICSRCGGKGVEKKKDKIEINIPAGVEDGMTLKMSGVGEAVERSGRPGDLYIQIHVQEDKRFSREGDDIFTSAKISFAQAGLGAKINVETLDGEILLKIPEGTQPGTKFRLRGEGVRYENGQRGDMYVIINVEIPRKLTRRQRQILEEFNE